MEGLYVRKKHKYCQTITVTEGEILEEVTTGAVQL